MLRLKIIFFVLFLLSFTYSPAQSAEVPYEFNDGQPASASEVNANFRALRDAINRIGDELINENKKTSQETIRLNRLESIISDLQKDVNELKQKNINIRTPRDPVNNIYGVQELDHLTASITKLIVSPNHNVTVFIKYENKENKDYYIGLSGCASNWQRKTFLSDEMGNIYTIKTASGIGYIGCSSINDPVFLRSGSNATFSIIFERPRSVDAFGSTYSLSIAQHSGILNADGKWKKIRDFNVSIGDMQPSK